MNQISGAGLTDHAIFVRSLLTFSQTRPSKEQVTAKIGEIEKTHPSIHEKAKIVAELAKVIVRDFLSHLNRSHTYKFRTGWFETFTAHDNIKSLFDYALAHVELTDRDPQIRKEARTVRFAVAQAKMFEIINRKDRANEENSDAFHRLLEPFVAEKIPLHKLTKNYQALTNTIFDEASKATLKRWILSHMLQQRSGTADCSCVIPLLEQLIMTDRISLNEIHATIDFYDLPPKTKSYFTLSETLCSIFSGTESTQTLQSVEQTALNKRLSVVQLFNFAYELFIFRKGTPNALTAACRQIADKNGLFQAMNLAKRFYRSYIQDKSDTFAKIMKEVDRLHLGPQFADCLMQVASKHLPDTQNEKIIHAISAIYHAMNTLGTHQHTMQPTALMQCAEAAEYQFRNSVSGQPIVISGVAPRTFIYDPQQQSISFLNKSKGGKAPVFGTFKEVSSTLTITKTVRNDEVQYTAQTRRAATIKKDLIFSKISTALWERELEALRLNRGLEGLLSYETIATYTQKVGEFDHKRVITIMKDYDFDTFKEFPKKKDVPFQDILACYVAVAKGLYNLHFPPNDAMKRKPRVHGDINPRNMLAALDGSAVIGDFGFVTYPSDGESLPLFAPYYGSVGYSDPEVTIASLQAKESKKSELEAVFKLDQFALDCFAMGVSMHHSLYGILPKALISQQTHYKAKTMTLEQAIAIKEEHIAEQDLQQRSFEMLAKRTVQQEFERLAWMLMHPNANLRLNASGLLASLFKLQESPGL